MLIIAVLAGMSSCCVLVKVGHDVHGLEAGVAVLVAAGVAGAILQAARLTGHCS